MKNFLFKLLIILGLTVKLGSVFAQVTFPVQVSTRILPPYSMSLSDYANPADERIYFTVTQTDAQYASNIFVEYRLHIQNMDRLHLIADVTSLNASPKNELVPNIPVTISGSEIAECFNVANLKTVSGTFNNQDQLPEGIYTFTLEVILKGTTIQLSNIQKDNFPIWLKQNDPPFLTFPMKDALVDATKPGIINFSWTPRNISPVSSALTYTFYLIRIEDDNNPASAYVTMDNFANIPSTQLVFSHKEITSIPTIPALNPQVLSMAPGYKYAWMVEASDPGSKGIFKNNGRSEVFWFNYDLPCNPLISPVLDPNNQQGFNLQLPGCEHTKFELKYKKLGSSDPWQIEQIANVNPNVPVKLQSKMLEAGATYEVQVNGMCRSLRTDIEKYITTPYIYAGPVTIPAQSQPCVPPVKFNSVIASGKTNLTFDQSGSALSYIINYRLEGEIFSQYTAIESKTGTLTGNTIAIEIPLAPTASKKLEIRIDALCADQSINQGQIFAISTSGGQGGLCALDQPFSLNIVTDPTSKKTSVSWKAQSEHTGYSIIYKLQGTNIYKVANPAISNLLATAELNNVEEKQIYEYTISPTCSNSNLVSISEKGLFLVPTNLNTNIGTGDCFAPLTVLSEVDKIPSATLSWDKPKDALSYELFYKLKSDNNWTYKQLIKNSFVISPLQISSIYEFKVRAICKSGGQSEYTNIKTFNSGLPTNPGTCEKVKLIDTLAVGKNGMYLQWDSIPSHTTYTVYFKEDSQSISDWYQQFSANRKDTLKNLQSGKIYNIKVEAHCGVDIASKSSQFDFKTKENPDFNACGKDINPFTFGSGFGELAEDSTFMAADFPIYVSEITGGNKTSGYKGNGKLEMPMMNYAAVMVTLDNVVVDEFQRMKAGKVIVNGLKIVPIGMDLADQIKDYSEMFDQAMETIFGPQTPVLEQDTTKKDPDAQVEIETFPQTDVTTTDDGSVDSGTSTSGNGTTTDPITTTDPTSDPITTTNPTSDPITTTNPTTTTTDPATTTPAKVYSLKFSKKLYGNGQTITIPYSRAKLGNNVFEMVTLSETSPKVEWSTLNTKDEIFYTFPNQNPKKKFGFRYKDTEVENLPNFEDWFHPLTFKLKSKYLSVTETPEVTVTVNHSLPTFSLTDFKITHSRKAATGSSDKFLRVAKNNETMYLVDYPIVTDKRGLIVSCGISPASLKIDNIPYQNIRWYGNEYAMQKHWGEKSFDYVVNDIRDVLVKLSAGYPTLASKQANVKWVDRNEVAIAIMPPATNLAVKTAFEKLKKINDIFNKLTKDSNPCAKVETALEPLKLSGSRFNEEDFTSNWSVGTGNNKIEYKGSRNYLTVEEGGIGVGAASTFTGNLICFVSPTLAKYLQANVKIFAKSGIELKISKKVNGITKAPVENTKTGTIKATVGAAGGVAIVPLKENDVIEIEASAEITFSASGKLEWNFTQNELVGKLVYDPITLQGVFKVKTPKTSSFEFDLIDIDETWVLVDEQEIYNYTLNK